MQCKIAARQGNLDRNVRSYAKGGELERLGVGPSAISQFDHLLAQNPQDLRA